MSLHSGSSQVQPTGYYFFYTIKQYQIKEDIKHQMLAVLPENELEIFAADDKNIVWEEEEKEFSINRKMYDIAKIKILDSKKYFYCLNDEQETKLIANFSKNIQDKTNQNNHQKEGKHTIKFQTISFHNQEKVFFVYSIKNNKIQYPIIQQHSVSAMVSVIPPPPKV